MTSVFYFLILFPQYFPLILVFYFLFCSASSCRKETKVFRNSNKFNPYSYISRLPLFDLVYWTTWSLKVNKLLPCIIPHILKVQFTSASCTRLIICCVQPYNYFYYLSSRNFFLKYKCQIIDLFETK